MPCESCTSLQTHLPLSIPPISLHLLLPSLLHSPFSLLSLPSLSLLISSSLIRGSPSIPQCTLIGQCVVHHHGNQSYSIYKYAHTCTAVSANAIKLPPVLLLSSHVFLPLSVLVLHIIIILIIIRREDGRVRSLTVL